MRSRRLLHSGADLFCEDRRRHIRDQPPVRWWTSNRSVHLNQPAPVSRLIKRKAQGRSAPCVVGKIASRTLVALDEPSSAKVVSSSMNIFGTAPQHTI